MALSVSQLASVTEQHFIKKIVDGVFDSNSLLFRLKKKGIKYSGGRNIVQPLVYATTTAAGAYQGYEVLSTAPNDNITAAVFEYRQHYAHMAISGQEELQNSGPEQMLSLLDAKRQVAQMTLEHNLGTGVQGSNSSGKDIDGMGLLLVGATSTYAGISSDDMSTWVANVHTLLTAGTLTLKDMQLAWGASTIGSDHPTCIATKQRVYDKFWSLLQPDQRFVSTEMGNAGFQSLSFNGVPVLVDSHITGTASTADNWMEFLNERYLHLAIHKDFNFRVVPIPVQRDQDVKMVRILFAGNLICSNRRMQGVIKTINPDL